MFPHTWAKGGVQLFSDLDVFADRTVLYEFEIRICIKRCNFFLYEFIQTNSYNCYTKQADRGCAVGAIFRRGEWAFGIRVLSSVGYGFPRRKKSSAS